MNKILRIKEFSSVLFVLILFGSIFIYSCDKDEEPITNNGNPNVEDTTSNDTVPVDTIQIDTTHNDSILVKDSLVVSFTETDKLLKNPHRGFQTEGRSISEETTLTKYKIPSSSIYKRFYWYSVEPKEGVYDFSQIDNLLSKGKAENQTFSFRIMCIASPGDTRDVTPKWFQNTECNHWYLNNANYIPDMDDPIFKKHMYALIEKLGEKYANDSRVDMIDIGIVGLWGEWHNGDDTDFPLPSPETRKELINLFFTTFPNKYKIINIESYEEDILQYAVGEGCGVRTDGIGDVWHHTYFFPTNYQKVPDAWKYAPIEGEAYSLINDWDNDSWRGGGKNYGLKNTIDDLLSKHYTLFNWMHGSNISSNYMLEEVKRFERKLGYRIVLSKFMSNKTISNNSIEITVDWKNTGVAPPYWDYFISYKLVDEQGNSKIFSTNKTIKGWLPGDIRTDQTIDVSSLQSGEYTIFVGLVNNETNSADIKLAIDCEEQNNWYKMGDITIE